MYRRGYLGNEPLDHLVTSRLLSDNIAWSGLTFTAHYFLFQNKIAFFFFPPYAVIDCASAFNTDLFECALCLLVKYLLVCIATNTPEDGRVVDETWLLAVAALHAAHSLNTQLWAPLSAAKPAYFLNYTPLLKSGRFLFCFFANCNHKGT